MDAREKHRHRRYLGIRLSLLVWVATSIVIAFFVAPAAAEGVEEDIAYTLSLLLGHTVALCLATWISGTCLVAG